MTNDSNILQDCCADSSIAQILTEYGLCSARFAMVSSEILSFDLIDTVDIFNALSICSVTFTANRTGVFLARIRNYEPPRLEVDVPEWVTTVEGRMTFRVPIADNSDLSGQVMFGERQWLARPIDISFGGVLLELSGEDVPELSVGAELQVELRLGQAEITLRGEVRYRQDDRRYGIHFVETVHNGRIEPPDVLRDMVVTLERQWLQRRLT